MKTALLTLAAMLAFAANSVLNRLALAEGLIDPVSFSSIRLLSGAVALLPLLFVLPGRFDRTPSLRTVISGIALFAYAIGFSLAYVSLGAGTGALILFGTVQITMISVSVFRGKRLTRLELTGLSLASLGLAWFLLPGATAPSLNAALLMMLAGLAWGIYSLMGAGLKTPILATARNFWVAAPLVLLLIFPVFNASAELTREGVFLAIASGVIASAFGYVIWFAALRTLSPVQAPVVQLSVPLLAALGGIVFIGEALTVQFAMSAALVLVGIYLTIYGRQRG